jgi:hypothetical protein
MVCRIHRTRPRKYGLPATNLVFCRTRHRSSAGRNLDRTTPPPALRVPYLGKRNAFYQTHVLMELSTETPIYRACIAPHDWALAFALRVVGSKGFKLDLDNVLEFENQIGIDPKKPSASSRHAPSGRHATCHCGWAICGIISNVGSKGRSLIWRNSSTAFSDATNSLARTLYLRVSEVAPAGVCWPTVERRNNFRGENRR